MSSLLRLLPNRVRREGRMVKVILPASLLSKYSPDVVRQVFCGVGDLPIAVTEPGTGNRFWLYDEKLWVTKDHDLKPGDVAALADEAANRRRLQLDKAHALQSMAGQIDQDRRRAPVPQDVKIAVWQRDGGRCVECGAQSDLEFDHIIPLAMGGANSLRNLQLLCGTCNRRKGATLG